MSPSGSTGRVYSGSGGGVGEGVFDEYEASGPAEVGIGGGTGATATTACEGFATGEGAGSGVARIGPVGGWETP